MGNDAGDKKIQIQSIKYTLTYFDSEINYAFDAEPILLLF